MKALKANKFRVGDKVQVIEDNCTEEWFSVEDQYIDGIVVQVNPEDKTDRYYVKIKGFKGVYDDGCFAFNDEHLKLIEACETVSEQDKTESKPYNPLIAQEGIKSDGGSSDYYFTKLPQELIDQIVKTGGIEIKDIARYVYDNNADAFNIIKAQKRIIEANKGVGKAGITKLYDAKKISFFANEQYEAIKREGTNE